MGTVAGYMPALVMEYMLDIMAPYCFPAATSLSLMCDGGWKYLQRSRKHRSYSKCTQVSDYNSLSTLASDIQFKKKPRIVELLPKITKTCTAGQACF